MFTSLKNINNLNHISKLLNGLNKSVYIINQFKPIYNDLKPVISKGQKFLNGFNNQYNVKESVNVIPLKRTKYMNNPRFFL